MDIQLNNKQSELEHQTVDIIVKMFIFNENNLPTKLISSDDSEYLFPKIISINKSVVIPLKNFLLRQKKIKILHDNINRIHKINNLLFNWYENNNYKLMILSFTKGLLFNDYIEANVYENVHDFYIKYGYDKFFTEGLEITIIIKDILPVDIPLKY